MPDEWFVAYAKLHLAEDFLRCGWMPDAGLDGTLHGQYVVLMRRPSCQCGKGVPFPSDEVRA